MSAALRRVPAGHIEMFLAKVATPEELPLAIARKRRGPVKARTIARRTAKPEASLEALAHGFTPFEID